MWSPCILVIFGDVLGLGTGALPFLLPFGVLALFRWSIFMLRLVGFFLYKPMPRLIDGKIKGNEARYRSDVAVTIIVPTVDAGPEMKQALASWLANNPASVIVVTEHKKHKEISDALAGADLLGRIKVVSIPKADKRKQLVYGIRLAQTPIVVFSDDDAVWTPAMLDYILGSFEDPSMGGVNTSQRMMPCNPNGRISAWEILADMRLSLRTVEAAASTYIDGGVSCLSGRTAAYRRLIVADPAFEEGFLNDYWLGRYRLMSGDDKFLTRWLVSHGWRTYVQIHKDATLLTTFKDNWHFLKQVLRWTRNTWRSDIRSLFVERFVWRRHPFLAFSMLDKFINPLTLIYGPSTAIYIIITSSSSQTYLLYGLLFYIGWLFGARLVRLVLHYHFVRRASDFLYLLHYVAFNVGFAVLKMYAFFTLHETGWGTRKAADGSDPNANVAVAATVKPKASSPDATNQPQTSNDAKDEPETVVDIPPQTTPDDSDEDWGDASQSNDGYADTHAPGSGVGRVHAPTTADIALTVLPRLSMHSPHSHSTGSYEPLVSSPSSAGQIQIAVRALTAPNGHGGDHAGDSECKLQSTLPPVSSCQTPRGLRLISPRDLLSQSSADLLSNAEPDAQLLVRSAGQVGMRLVTPRGSRQPDNVFFYHNSPAKPRRRNLSDAAVDEGGQDLAAIADLYAMMPVQSPRDAHSARDRRVDDANNREDIATVAPMSAVMEAVLLEVEAEIMATDHEAHEAQQARELPFKEPTQGPSLLMLVSIAAALALIVASFAVPATVLYSQIYNSESTTQRDWVVTAFITFFGGCLSTIFLIIAIYVVIELIVRPKVEYSAPPVEREDSFFFLQRARRRRQVYLFELAEADFERSIQLQPSAMALRERAWMYEEMSAAAITQLHDELVAAGLDGDLDSVYSRSDSGSGEPTFSGMSGAISRSVKTPRTRAAASISPTAAVAYTYLRKAALDYTVALTLAPSHPILLLARATNFATMDLWIEALEDAEYGIGVLASAADTLMQERMVNVRYWYKDERLTMFEVKLRLENLQKRCNNIVSRESRRLGPANTGYIDFDHASTYSTDSFAPRPGRRTSDIVEPSLSHLYPIETAEASSNSASVQYPDERALNASFGHARDVSNVRLPEGTPAFERADRGNFTSGTIGHVASSPVPVAARHPLHIGDDTAGDVHFTYRDKREDNGELRERSAEWHRAHELVGRRRRAERDTSLNPLASATPAFAVSATVAPTLVAPQNSRRDPQRKRRSPARIDWSRGAGSYQGLHERAQQYEVNAKYEMASLLHKWPFLARLVPTPEQIRASRTGGSSTPRKNWRGHRGSLGWLSRQLSYLDQQPVFASSSQHREVAGSAAAVRVEGPRLGRANSNAVRERIYQKLKERGIVPSA